MDIEQLTKTQLVLLALLVSFVTSIATGIATASLLEQAPPEVTRVIDRVVERTVETVTSTEGTVTEKTVVIREDDLISDSIASITQSLVRIYADAPEGKTFVGMGFIVSSEGSVIASSVSVDAGKVYDLRLKDGTVVKSETIREDEGKGLALLKVVSQPENFTYTPIAFGDTKTIKLGQSIIAVSGEQNNVSAGIVSNIKYTIQADDTEPSVSSLQSNIASASALAGTPLINLFGDVVGVKTSTDSSFFVPVSVVENFLSSGQ